MATWCGVMRVRVNKNSPPFGIGLKRVGFFSGQLVQALEAGADEALMLDIHGFVATCNATNFFVVRKGEVWTSTGQYCMNGITRGKIITLCRQQGIPVYEKNFSLVDVYDADEAFVTGTFGGLTPVINVDGRTIGTGKLGPLTTHLRSLYHDEIHRWVQQAQRSPAVI